MPSDTETTPTNRKRKDVVTPDVSETNQTQIRKTQSFTGTSQQSMGTATNQDNAGNATISTKNNYAPSVATNPLLYPYNKQKKAETRTRTNNSNTNKDDTSDYNDSDNEDERITENNSNIEHVDSVDSTKWDTVYECTSSSNFLKNLSDDLSVSPLRKDQRITIQQVMMESYSYGINNTRTKYILGMIVHTIKGATQSSYGIYRYGKSTNSIKQVSSTYNRIMLCADLSSEIGQVFAVLFPSHAISNSALKLARDDQFSDIPFLGAWVAIVNPIFRRHFLSSDKDVPILEIGDSVVSSYIVPLVRDQIAIETPIKLGTPLTAITRWTRFIGAEVVFNCGSVTTASCSGVFCDRDKNRGWFTDNSRTTCFCFNKGMCATAFVANQVRIYAPNSDLLTAEKNGISPVPIKTVDNYSSLRLLRLFFGREISETKADNLCNIITRMEDHIRRKTRKINKNGGWEIYGWFKHGEKVDASLEHQTKSDLYNVICTSFRFHIAYMYPVETTKTFLTSLLFDFNAPV